MPYLQQTLQCNAAGVVKSWMIGGDEKHSNVQTQGKIYVNTSQPDGH
jgi:hypothetical protein